MSEPTIPDNVVEDYSQIESLMEQAQSYLSSYRKLAILQEGEAL